MSDEQFTKRERIAAMALQGMLSDTRAWDDLFDRVSDDETPEDWYAQNAVAYADALLGELARPILFRFRAVLDERTCSRCTELDGKTFPLAVAKTALATCACVDEEGNLQSRAVLERVR